MYKTRPKYILNNLCYYKARLNTYALDADDAIDKAKYIDGSDQWFTDVDIAMQRFGIQTADEYCDYTRDACDRFLASDNARGVQKCMNRIDAVRDSGQDFVSSQAHPADTEATRDATNKMLDCLIEMIRHKVVTAKTEN